jgi:Holliday junction resolvase RusA-like endonuclease
MGVSFMLNPVPASRPRVTRWGTYYSKTYTNWRKEAMGLIKEAKTTIDNCVTVLVEQIVEKPKTSKKKFPRGDVDNYAKAPTDILTTKKFWTDDDLITGLWTSKRFAEEGEEPRTEVTIYVHNETS